MRCQKLDLVGGTPDENAEITTRILRGEYSAKYDAAVLNAGAALYLGGKADSIKDGIVLARELIASGKALATLEKVREISARPGGEA